MDIRQSTRKEKKYMVKVNNRTIHFGSAGMSDYTKHKDPVRKERYLKRHAKRENWNDPNTAGFWARWILWNQSSITASIQDINTRFKSLRVTRR